MTGHFLDLWLLRALILFCFLLSTSGGTAGLPSPRRPAAAVPRGIAASAAVPLPGQEIPSPQDQATAEQNEPLTGLSKKQKRDLMKANYEKMKRDADELATLAKSLQEDIDKGNENVLSLQVVDKAEKIEKLAKRIKSVARGY